MISKKLVFRKLKTNDLIKKDQVSQAGLLVIIVVA